MREFEFDGATAACGYDAMKLTNDRIH